MTESDNRNNKKKSFSLGELAGHLRAAVKGNPEIRIEGVGSLEDACPGQLSFISDKKYLSLLSQTKASALIVSPALQDIDFPLLVCKQPYLALARVGQLFVEPPFLPPGIHDSVCLGENIQLGEDVRVGPLVQIGNHSEIGRGTRIYGGAYIGAGVSLGQDCLIYPGVTILDGCRIGNRVTIHSGTVIGADGFGFAQDEEGHHVKIPQVGIVQIDDDVEIGANCTIDRATFGRTWVQRGTKIDNLVMLAHNVVVGEHSIIVSQVGISGSTRLGKHVILAGQVGVVGHIEIGDGVRIGAKAGVSRSIKAGQDVAGIPALPHREWLRVMGNLRRLPQYKDELMDLKKKIAELEASLHRE
ncbi:UDP-3-O-(3-hydroxymyristoyl)glucosamine N-acyltransferase [Desulforhabdus amnigena]|jgi:UDP-3-O-[3-hydroxymyristoyl] glucosamine N-acyltransferase|uniref:UDP-3-O-(3-hydroxymyristoyl)glucosamine N-acyltransferase n=1 Tax=Desulforhabdus amnigena TaxID=40218 RepID=UPI0016BD2994|nr:UDP-3-O-(3-hydroxymyristoyl)glucosamine N-acyltransferase [Desulforhabdus amnigena]NLJ26785.1 UDP-3-O-(3-hydroxymyristoyl)glucosamine N-acyltransferase [Deltaproteobacteria bacterium]